LLAAAKAAEPRGWDMSKQREKDGDETLAKNGMTLHEPSAAMKAAFSKVGAQMAKEWEAKAGADGQTILKAYKK
jgi:TRAP-type C4-dicarboxylate transport system substrate-binding protein